MMSKGVLLSITTAALLCAGSSAALASDLTAQNVACQDAVIAGLPAALSDTQIRFAKRRGTGKKQRLVYHLSTAQERGMATCTIIRGEVQEVRFNKSFRTVIAAAQ